MGNKIHDVGSSKNYIVVFNTEQSVYECKTIFFLGQTFKLLNCIPKINIHKPLMHEAKFVGHPQNLLCQIIKNFDQKVYFNNGDKSKT